jgi:hypothetical protein
MINATSRRSFLHKTSLGGAAVALADLGFLSQLPPVSAAEATLDVVRLRPEMEPVVRLIESTPREKLLEEVATRIKSGKLRYQEVLGALLLAGVRNVQPRPSVGFKFHAVLVVNSAHLASVASPDGERWLPIFWALDEFKSSQARDEQEGDWTMAPVDEAKVPPAHRARAAFIKAMDTWDVDAADVAVASLARNAPVDQVFELFARYGARDFRSIGHKAIFVANSFRALQVIGWRHAEPVLRSLAYALLNHNGQPNPAESDLDADRPWRENGELVEKFPKGWRGGALNRDASGEIITSLRDASPSEAAGKVVELLGKGVAAQSVYDGLLVGSGELLMRQPGIIALHAMTTTNAIRYIFNTTASENTRRRLLMQNASFLPLFRDAMPGRGKVGGAEIDTFESRVVDGDKVDVVDAIFQDVGRDRNAAAGKLLGQLDSGLDPKAVLDTARRYVFLKGSNSHDYKFSSAVLEDFYQVSPAWRNRYLAATVFQLRGAGDKDNALVQRARAALG